MTFHLKLIYFWYRSNCGFELLKFAIWYWRRKWQPTPVFLPGESQGLGSLVGCPLTGLHRVGHDWCDLAAAAAIWYCNTFLNKYGSVIHHFNAYFSLHVLLLMTLLAIYFIFILEYRNDVRQKANWSSFFYLRIFFYSSSKWVIKQQTQLTTSALHLAQELLTDIQRSGDSRSFAKKMRALKMRSAVASHRKFTKTNWDLSS